jgi:hypothetical protein
MGNSTGSSSSLFHTHPLITRLQTDQKAAIPAAVAPEWAIALAQEAAHLYFVPHPLIARLRTDQKAALPAAAAPEWATAQEAARHRTLY